MSKFSTNKFAVTDLYSFASAEEVRVVLKIPLKKDIDQLPDRVLVFDEEGKCSGIKGVPPPPPPPPAVVTAAPELPKSVVS